MHVAAYEQVVEHGGVVEQFGVLERTGDPEFGDPMSRHPAHVFAVEQHDARIRVVYAVDQVEDRRLSGPVRADDAEHFSPANLEGHVAHRLYAAEAQRQVACFEKRRLVRMCPGLVQLHPLRPQIGFLALVSLPSGTAGTGSARIGS